MKTRIFDRCEYRRAGLVLRTHGKEGGLQVSWEAEENPFEKEGIRFVVIDLDGKFIPFLVVAHEPGPGGREVLFLEDVNTPEEAAQLTGHTYYLHQRFLEDIQSPLDVLEPGKFVVVDTKFGELGRAMGVVGTDENPLLEVKAGNREILIPVQGNFILAISDEESVIRVDIPEELVRLNEK
ncbi:MAG: hypothetical protein ACP5O2_01110 [Bacteroidales bacterium]